MRERRALPCLIVLALLVPVACTLTSSLDDLSGGELDAASAGSGGVGGSAGSAGTGGGFPDASAGSGGSGGSSGTSGAGGASGSGGTQSFDPPWWDAAWPARVQLFVQSSAALPLPAGFELGFEIDVAQTFGSASPSFAIARYEPVSQTWSARPTYYESVAGKTWIWTPLAENLEPDTVDSSSFLYAGNANAGPSDPNSVFLFFDGFDSGSGSWLTQGSPAFGAGELVLPSYSSIRSDTQYGPGHAVDFALEVDTAVSGQFDWISGGFQRSVDFDNVEPWIIWVNRTAGSVRPEVDISAVSAQEIGNNLSIPVGQRRIYGVERFASHAIFRRDHQIEQTLTWSTQHTTGMQVRFTTQSASAQATFDFVRFRRASDPAPTASLGSVETLP